MADDCILYWKQQITVGNYNKMVEEKDVKGIAEFIGGRFTERYFAPLEVSKAKSGFCLMAVSCLMIEALQCFWEGLPRTPRSQGADFFTRFFDRNSNMGIPSRLGGRFYGSVRNGILHQAETTDGWKIRLGTTPLFDEGTKTINAEKFHKELKRCLQQYCDALKNNDWESDLWKNFRKKMKQVCANC